LPLSLWDKNRLYAANARANAEDSIGAARQSRANAEDSTGGAGQSRANVEDSIEAVDKPRAITETAKLTAEPTKVKSSFYRQIIRRSRN
jgi:hypothetical protein